tara:strand:+ start:192 stop:347 length:156 start_codon:yes stop_codon:yes gene_type:complete
MKFEDKEKCTRCRVAMKRVAMTFKNNKVQEVYKCPSCGSKKIKDEKSYYAT